VSEEVTPIASHSGTDDPLFFYAVGIVCSALDPNSDLPRNHNFKKRRYRLLGEYAFRCAHLNSANDPSSATRRTGGNDCNRDALAGLDAMMG